MGITFFEIPNGTYDLKYDLKYILKGYQPILIKNYKSYQDQFTTINIDFQQGSETQTFNCPKWTK